MLLQVNENVTSSELFSTFLKEVYRFKGWFIQNNTCLSLCSPDFKHFSLLNAKKKCNYFDFKDFCRDISKGLYFRSPLPNETNVTQVSSAA
jgi:hypothetical protein